MSDTRKIIRVEIEWRRDGEWEVRRKEGEIRRKEVEEGGKRKEVREEAPIAGASAANCSSQLDKEMSNDSSLMETKI